MIKKFTLFCLAIGVSLYLVAQEKDSLSAFSYEASYVGDGVHNFMGGIKKGSAYLGMATIGIGFNTAAANLWKGGEFYVLGAGIHGTSPTEKLLGDAQVASNLDAGNHMYIQEAWYKHTFSPLAITIGAQDLNAAYMSSEYGGEYSNSSFGVPPVISDNVPLSIFPLTTIGISVTVPLSKSVTWQGAFFDGMSTDFSTNPYNVNWQLKKAEGWMAISELQYTSQHAIWKGTYEIGGYYHSKLIEKDPDTGISSNVFNQNNGLYFFVDKPLWTNKKDKTLAFFVQTAFSPKTINDLHYCVGGGFNYYGIRGEDLLGLGIVQAGFNHGIEAHETVLELFYKTQVNEHIFLKPDLQYIINPSGTDSNLEDALALLLRLELTF